MKKFGQDNEKNKKIEREREISFETATYFIEKAHVLDDIENLQMILNIDDIGHPNREKYSNQNIFVININGYAYLVPYVESDNEIFLKTIIPSRKATQKYLRGKK